MAKISPLDIKRQKFKKSIRGYDPEEVDVFLEIVAERLEELTAKNDEMKGKIIHLETKLEEYQKNERNINDILSRTREMQEEAARNLKKQETIILKDAEYKAVEILENARKEARQIREEVMELQHKKDSFMARLKYLIQSYVDLLKMLEVENLVKSNGFETSPSAIEAPPVRGKRSGMKRERKAASPEESNEIFVHDISDLMDKLDSENASDDDKKSENL